MRPSDSTRPPREFLIRTTSVFISQKLVSWLVGIATTYIDRALVIVLASSDSTCLRFCVGDSDKVLAVALWNHNIYLGVHY